MAHTASARKNTRKMIKRRAQNVARSSRYKTEIKRVLAAVAAGDLAAAQKGLPAAMQALDKAARHRVIHKNTAANKKSVLARGINRLVAKSA